MMAKQQFASHTYIRLRQGFVYLVAIMDWFSRYVLAWEVSAMCHCLTRLNKSRLLSACEYFGFFTFSQPVPFDL
jgi:transposase InsO family protein